MAEAPVLPRGLSRSRAPLTRPEVYPARVPRTSSKTSPAAKAGVICSGTLPRFLPKGGQRNANHHRNRPQRRAARGRAARRRTGRPQAAGHGQHPAVRPGRPAPRASSAPRRPTCAQRPTGWWRTASRPRSSRARASCGRRPTRPARRPGSCPRCSTPIKSRSAVHSAKPPILHSNPVGWEASSDTGPAVCPC